MNGRVRCIRFESIPRLLEDGDTVWTGTVEDVTESRHAEERRRESEALFRSFFEMPLVGACITSPTKGWLEVNDQLCRMLGYTREELASLTWASLTHPDDLDADVTRFERVARGEIDGYSLEKRFLRKDGSVVPVHLSVSCVRTGDGAVDYFVALLQDITERRKVEGELRTHREHLEALVAERTAELDRQRHLLDETSRLARVGGWEYDVRKAELTWTDVVREIHEVEPGFRMTVENGLEFYAPESRPVIANLLARAIATGEPFDAEVQLDTAKGRRVWVRAIGRAYVEDGKVVRVGGVLQDIDARRSAEEDLRRHRAHLEELVAERTAELEKSRSRLVEAQAVAHLGSWGVARRPQRDLGLGRALSPVRRVARRPRDPSSSSSASSTPTTGRRRVAPSPMRWDEEGERSTGPPTGSAGATDASVTSATGASSPPTSEGGRGRSWGPASTSPS
ncbi:MAG: PAS domain S-box protein [Holophagales bacterium]|nr:PAS domain S-box protein [Holophagales bacterium]